MTTLEDINDFKVKPLPIPPLPPLERIKGSDLFGMLYKNCFICAPKNSGKTQALSNILMHTIGKKTNLIFFVSTASKDATYEALFELLERKKINYVVHSSIFNDNGKNVLEQLITSMLDQPDVPRTNKTVAKKVEPVISLFENHVEEPKKERKEKKDYPKFVFVFDDLSTELRDPSIAKLLKIHRHLKSCVFMSSQRVTDLTPASFNQLDYCLIFRGYSSNVDRLQAIYQNIDVPIPFEQFVEMYRTATAEPYNFFYISKNNEYRKNFNQRFVL
jgi:hypothetical protein